MFRSLSTVLFLRGHALLPTKISHVKLWCGELRVRRELAQAKNLSALVLWLLLIRDKGASAYCFNLLWLDDGSGALGS